MSTTADEGVPIETLVEELSRPTAYSHDVSEVTVRHTHISVVFLAGDYAYKVKKPLDLGFLDFTTLERRRHFCAEEVRLNRRGADDVYLGVVPITRDGDRLVMDGEGAAVEHAVRMRRLPHERTLEALLERGALDADTLDRVARRIADFHARAEAGAHIDRWGHFDVVAGNAHENFEQIEPYVGRSISRPVFERLRDRSLAELTSRRPLIEERARRGATRDTHGDLHLDHVYVFPDQPAPGDLVLVDCIEFNERFRFADPVSDVAFMAMDLRFRGRPDLAERLAATYFAATGDTAGRELLPYYTSYRSIVRGKVESFVLDGAEVPAAARDQALRGARGHFLLALGALEPPRMRPCLVLVAGLPGTGKTTVARVIEAEAECARVSTDVVRKEMAGVPWGPGTDEGGGGGGQDLYTAEWNDRTYDECLTRASALLADGRRVVVDGTFREEARRGAFLDTARAMGVPALVLVCEADPGVVRERLARREGDASDADWAVYQALADRWQPLGPETARLAATVDNNGRSEEAGAMALARLAAAGLY